MSFLWGRREEQRGTFQQVFGTGGDITGVRATSAEKALAVVAVYSAVGYNADMFAATPWAVYRDKNGLPEKVDRQPRLVTNPGNGKPDLFTWKHQLCSSLELWGNAYGVEVAWDGGGVPSRIEWLRPDRVEVDESGPVPLYKYEGKPFPGPVVHVANFTLPGSIVGLSPLGLFRTQFETGLEAARVGRNQFKRGLAPAGLLKNTAKALTQDQADAARKRFVASVSTSEPFVTGNDWDYTTLQLPQSDVNFITGSKLTATQIAAIYRVAPEVVGGETSGNSLTYKSLEQEQIRYNIVKQRPLAARVEPVFSAMLPQPQYLKLNLDSGVRADLKTRYEAHEIALRAGFKTVNEIRELEELPPIAEPVTVKGGADA